MPSQQMRGAADWTARIVALVVFVLGAMIVVKPAVDHLSQVWSDDPFGRDTATKTVTKNAGGVETTTTTVQPSDESMTEHALGDSGILLVRLGVVALAAFLAGAVVQRALLARFAIKIGGLEVPELEEAAASSDAFQKLTKQMGKLKQRTRTQQQEIADLKSGAANDVQNLAQLAEAIAELTRKVDPTP